jgi:ATP-dependent Clp protease protease subunit
MKLSQDYEKYLKDKKINSSVIDYYQRKNAYRGFDIHTNVFDKLLEDRIIFLSGEIDLEITELIKANMFYLESISDDDIKLYINSEGGCVYSGFGLLDVMDYITPDVSTINTGLAASMAAVILCSGTKGKRKALKRSRTMIHQPSRYGGWFQQASDVEIDAKEINFLKKELYEIISEKTGQNFDKVNKDGDRDYWMSASDAKKYGMVDEIIIKRK